jgi:hypothetical protein
MSWFCALNLWSTYSYCLCSAQLRLLLIRRNFKTQEPLSNSIGLDNWEVELGILGLNLGRLHRNGLPFFFCLSYNLTRRTARTTHNICCGRHVCGAKTCCASWAVVLAFVNAVLNILGSRRSTWLRPWESSQARSTNRWVWHALVILWSRWRHALLVTQGSPPRRAWFHLILVSRSRLWLRKNTSMVVTSPQPASKSDGMDGILAPLQTTPTPELIKLCGGTFCGGCVHDALTAAVWGLPDARPCG